MINKKLSVILLGILTAVSLTMPSFATYFPPNLDVMSATGGTVTTIGNYKVHTFTTSGNFTITSGSGRLDAILVVGGGGGGCGSDQSSGAGGAGRVVYESPSTTKYTPGVYPVIVGTGGVGQATGASGLDSVFMNYAAPGGGGGVCTTTGTPAGTGKDGGSGGGSSYTNTTRGGRATVVGLLTGNGIIGSGLAQEVRVQLRPAQFPATAEQACSCRLPEPLQRLLVVAAVGVTTALEALVALVLAAMAAPIQLSVQMAHPTLDQVAVAATQQQILAVMVPMASSSFDTNFSNF